MRLSIILPVKLTDNKKLSIASPPDNLQLSLPLDISPNMYYNWCTTKRRRDLIMLNLQKQLQDYLQDCRYRKELNPKTLKAYQIDLKQFMQFLAERKLKADKAGITEYLFYLHEVYKQRTTKRKIASLKAFFNYLEYEERIEINPMNRIRVKFKEERVLPRSVPYEIIEHLLFVMYGQYEEEMKLDKSFWKDMKIRDLAIIELLFMTGIRISELCSLRVEDINLVEGTIRVYGKGAKERVIPIGSQEVLSLLREYNSCMQRSEQPYFFLNRYGEQVSPQSVRNMIKKNAKKANIEMNITPHMFRHSFATLLLDQDVDIRIIQNLLGHSSIVTTQIYTYVTTEKKRNVLEKRHPRNQMKLRKYANNDII